MGVEFHPDEDLPLPLGPKLCGGALQFGFMHWLRRLVVVTLAIGVAIGAGLLSLPLVACADPLTRQPGFALMELTVAAIAGTGAFGGIAADDLARLTSF